MPTIDAPFEQALKWLKEGKKVTRQAWDDPEEFVEAQFPDAHSKMTDPYLFMGDVDGNMVPWEPGQVDLFATDWVMTA